MMSEGENSSVAISDYVDLTQQNGQVLTQEGFIKQWRNVFVSRGGFQYLISILMGYINTGIQNDLQLSLFSFILKLFKYFVLASVTITKPSMYKNIIYIKLRNADIKYLREQIEGDGSLPLTAE